MSQTHAWFITTPLERHLPHYM